MKILAFTFACAWLAGTVGCTGGVLGPGGGTIVGAAPDSEDEAEGVSDNTAGNSDEGSGGQEDGGAAGSFGNTFYQAPMVEIVPGPQIDPLPPPNARMETCAKILEVSPLGKAQVKIQGRVMCPKTDSHSVEFLPCSEGRVMRVIYNAAAGKITSEKDMQFTDLPLGTGGNFELTLFVSTQPEWTFGWAPDPADEDTSPFSPQDIIMKPKIIGENEQALGLPACSIHLDMIHFQESIMKTSF